MKNKQKKNEFESDFENNELNAEVTENDLSDAELTRAQQKMLKNAKKKRGEDRSQLDPYDKSDLAEARRYVKKHKLKVLFVTLTIAMLLAVLAAIVIFAVIQFKNGPSKNDYKVSVGDEDPYELDYDTANEYGQFYFDLTSIAKYAELTVTGSDGKNGKMTFWCEDKTYVRFVNGDQTAVVNGTPVDVGGAVHIISASNGEKSKCLVPFTFIQNLFSHKADNKNAGLAVQISDKNEVVIHRISYTNGTKPPISFSPDALTTAKNGYSNAAPTNHVDSETANALRTTNLALVNKSHALSSDEISNEEMISLSTLNCPVSDSIAEINDFFDPIAALALCAMINDANKRLEGDDKILVSSAYRSYSYQKGLHENYVKSEMKPGVSAEEAREIAEFFSAPAGASEHHLGLCVDVVDIGHEDQELSEIFAETPAYEWLSKNAHKYGFILRYPDNKTDITKYSYEPWHYRFVGVQAATIIYNDGLTLEEFLGDVK